MEPIARSELHTHLALFGLAYGAAGVDAALRAVGVKPAKYEGQAGGKGRIALYDPMVPWLLASVWESRKRTFSRLRKEIEYFRALYAQLAAMPEAASIPGFREDPEMGAQLLMLTSPLFGMEPRDIRRITFAEPKTLEYSRFGREFIVNVLQAYNNVYGETVRGLSVDPKAGPLPKRDRQVREFAESWLSEAALLFEVEEHNKHDQAEETPE